MKPVPVTTLSVAVLTLLAALFPSAGDWLEWSRPHIAASQAWRLVTGHFVHFGWAHLSWDVAAFLLLGILAEPLFGASKWRKGRTPHYAGLAQGTRFAVFIVGVGVCLSLAVLWLQPHLDRYRGLSGIDSALFGFIAQRLMAYGRSRRRRSLTWIGNLSLIGFLVKCGYELATRQSAFVGPAAALVFEPVPLVHGLGLLLGMGFASFTVPRRPAKTAAGTRSSKNFRAGPRRKEPQMAQINAD